MQISKKLWSLTATEALRLMKNDQITVEEYTRALVERVESRNSVVRAWKYFDSDLVLNQARALDSLPRNERGPLHGVAVGIKDIMDTKDMPTAYGCALYNGYQPTADSSIVDTLRRAGALIFGKTTTTEFTIPNSGPDTTNPHDPNRTPGGSSAGSAAAVADFQVPLSFGTQTGGSVIRPASYTGIYAMKPTYNQIDIGGIKVVSPKLDTLGYFARCMEDLELITNLLNHPADPSVRDIPLREARIGFVRSPFWSCAGPGTVGAMERAADILRTQGYAVEDVEFPDEFADAAILSQMLKAIFVTEAGTSFYEDYLMDSTKQRLHPHVRALVEEASKIPPEEVRQAFDCYASLRLALNETAMKYSALVTPSAVDEAPLGIDDMGNPIFNYLWTAAHMPVIHVPAFSGPNGMPVGLSLVSRAHRDQHLLCIAKVLSEPLVREGGWRSKLVDTEADIATQT